METELERLQLLCVRLTRKVEILEKCAEHYADKERWYCDAVHLHSLDDPDCFADSFNTGGNGYTIAQRALEAVKEEERRMLSEQVLTYDKLLDVIASIEPLPFVAFTMRPATYSAFMSQAQPSKTPILGSVDVYCVPRQVEDCLQWNDEKMLREYLNEEK